MEPSHATYREVGRLCAAWAYLEMRSEQTLWGILKLNPILAQAFVWRQQILQRWQMIVRESKKYLSDEADRDTVKEISRRVNLLAKDRNIIVHGVIHATAFVEEPVIRGSRIEMPYFHRVPCWTIFIGEDAGKSFPISTLAVRTVRLNIQTVADEIFAFNEKKGFTEGTAMQNVVQAEWPNQL